MSRPPTSKNQNSTKTRAYKNSKTNHVAKTSNASKNTNSGTPRHAHFNRSAFPQANSRIAQPDPRNEDLQPVGSPTPSNERLVIDATSSNNGELLRTQRVYCKFLGLDANETDESVILNASSRMAQLVNERKAFNSPEVIVRSRSEIALATYRLLDPRRRAYPWQRIQLIRPLNREDRHLQSSSSNSLWSQTEPASSAGDSEPDQNPPNESEQSNTPTLVTQERAGWINRRVIDRAFEQTASQATLVDSNHDARNWLEERREIVRTLKSSEDSMSRGKRQEKSTLSWLLSVFGR